MLLVDSRNTFLTGLELSIHKGINDNTKASTKWDGLVNMSFVLSHTWRLLCAGQVHSHQLCSDAGSEKNKNKKTQTLRVTAVRQSGRRVWKSSSSVRATSSCQSVICMIQLSFTPTHLWQYLHGRLDDLWKIMTTIMGTVDTTAVLSRGSGRICRMSIYSTECESIV